MNNRTKNAYKLNEEIHIDSLTRLSTCNSDARERAKILCELISQSDIHSKTLNLQENSANLLKSELYAEYFHIIDNDCEDDLLPEQKDNFAKSSISFDRSRDVKNVLNELNGCLSNLKLNTFVNKSYRSSESSTSQLSCNTNRKKSLFTKACNSVLSCKRTASDTDVTTLSGNTTKKPNISKIGCRPKNTSSNAKPKSGTGFISASNMYRNPMKKQNGEETQPGSPDKKESEEDEILKHFDKKIVDVIKNEVMDFSPNIKWTDIAGLEFVKQTVQEIVIWPLLRPDIFKGLRAPPRGILLFGPPGTGKTLIGKCIATESNSTFFCISASSLASKWVGESEQLVRALFTVARLNQPAVIFIDEIDSLLSQRSDKDQDFTRKLKTEFLVQFDGAKTDSEERILVVGATNRPHELDEAARRRFVKRLYVPLPEESGRRQIIEKLLSEHQHDLSNEDMQKVCDETKGYSCSDVTHLCKEAAMGPIRSIGPEKIKTVTLDQVRPILVDDFVDALRQVRASVAQDDLNYYLEWNKKFGSFEKM